MLIFENLTAKWRAQVLAQLHNVPFDDVGLGDYGKPQGYLLRCVSCLSVLQELTGLR